MSRRAAFWLTTAIRVPRSYPSWSSRAAWARASRSMSRYVTVPSPPPGADGSSITPARPPWTVDARSRKSAMESATCTGAPLSSNGERRHATCREGRQHLGVLRRPAVGGTRDARRCGPDRRAHRRLPRRAHHAHSLEGAPKGHIARLRGDVRPSDGTDHGDVSGPWHSRRVQRRRAESPRPGREVA